ncbi:MAG: hypothetical protein ABI741_06815 [Ferruginibacter sp.]
MIRKKIKSTILFLFVLVSSFCSGQVPVRSFAQTDLNEEVYSLIRAKVASNKIIPTEYEKPILLALCFFPELANIKIEFRIKHVLTPLSSRPAWTSIFLDKRSRKYVITISDKTIKQLSPILFRSLDFDAQVGVIGHEISHVVDFNNKNMPGILRVGFGNLSSKFLDKFEYGTDSICIAHGLGYQLLAWSINVRKALKHKNWVGADNINKMMEKERYMNPETIIRRMKSIEMYNNGQ